MYLKHLFKIIIGDWESPRVTMLIPVVILFTSSRILVKKVNIVILMILAGDAFIF